MKIAKEMDLEKGVTVFLISLNLAAIVLGINMIVTVDDTVYRAIMAWLVLLCVKNVLEDVGGSMK